MREDSGKHHQFLCGCFSLQVHPSVILRIAEWIHWSTYRCTLTFSVNTHPFYTCTSTHTCTCTSTHTCTCTSLHTYMHILAWEHTYMHARTHAHTHTHTRTHIHTTHFSCLLHLVNHIHYQIPTRGWIEVLLRVEKYNHNTGNLMFTWPHALLAAKTTF